MSEKDQEISAEQGNTGKNDHSPPRLEDPLLFSALINLSNDAIFIVDPENTGLLYANDKAYQNLGYPRDALLGMTIYDFALNVKNLQEWRDLVPQSQVYRSRFVPN